MLLSGIRATPSACPRSTEISRPSPKLATLMSSFKTTERRCIAHAAPRITITCCARYAVQPSKSLQSWLKHGRMTLRMHTASATFSTQSKSSACAATARKSRTTPYRIGDDDRSNSRPHSTSCDDRNLATECHRIPAPHMQPATTRSC